MIYEGRKKKNTISSRSSLYFIVHSNMNEENKIVRKPYFYVESILQPEFSRFKNSYLINKFTIAHYENHLTETSIFTYYPKNVTIESYDTGEEYYKLHIILYYIILQLIIIYNPTFVSSPDFHLHRSQYVCNSLSLLFRLSTK